MASPLVLVALVPLVSCVFIAGDIDELFFLT
jgi:hypothetical protein